MFYDPLAWIDDRLLQLEDQRLRRRLAMREGPLRSKIVLDSREMANFGSNDYLGLASDSRLVSAVIEATKSEGWGSGASPLLTGRGQRHAELEKTLARFEGTEAALLFPSGFAANAGTIAALVGKGDVILSDAKNHASIIDGCRLSGASIQVYRHRDIDHAQQILDRWSAGHRCLIVTDALFSMDGDLAPLGKLADLAEQYDAMLMVDEAHATGVFGRRGRGISEHFGVEDRVHVRVGTLSKALGSVGGYVAGSQRLIDWLTNCARSYVFSTAPPAAGCAAASVAVRIVRGEPERRDRLRERARCLRNRLREQGWQMGETQSQIIPLITGDPRTTTRIASGLRQRDLFVPAIRPPSVPEGQSLLRISLSYDHDDVAIAKLVDGLAEMRRSEAVDPKAGLSEVLKQA